MTIANVLHSLPPCRSRENSGGCLPGLTTQDAGPDEPPENRPFGTYPGGFFNRSRATRYAAPDKPPEIRPFETDLGGRS